MTTFAHLDAPTNAEYGFIVQCILTPAEDVLSRSPEHAKRMLIHVALEKARALAGEGHLCAKLATWRAPDMPPIGSTLYYVMLEGTEPWYDTALVMRARAYESRSAMGVSLFGSLPAYETAVVATYKLRRVPYGQLPDLRPPAKEEVPPSIIERGLSLVLRNDPTKDPFVRQLQDARVKICGVKV